MNIKKQSSYWRLNESLDELDDAIRDLRRDLRRMHADWRVIRDFVLLCILVLIMVLVGCVFVSLLFCVLR